MNRLSYTALDFDTANDELLARLQAEFATQFNDFSVSSLAIVLLDLESYGLDGLAFYLDRRAAEAYLETAETRGAVARLTRQLGYKMRSASSAAVDTSVTIPATLAYSAPIPKGFLFRGARGLVFEVAREVVFEAADTGGQVAKIVPLFEGQTYAETFVSDGTPDQVFALRRARDGKYVVSGSVEVTVNGTTWSESELLTFESTPQYEIGYNDTPPTLRFGGGSTGQIPPAGATIVVTYRACSGSNGRVGADAILGPVTPLVVNFETVELAVSSPGGSSGGDDPEPLAEARAKAPQAWKSRQVAVTRKDYEALASSFADSLAGRVSVAQAFVARSVEGDLELQGLVRSVLASTSAPVLPTSTALADVRARLAEIQSELGTLHSTLAATATEVAGMDASLAAIQAATRQVEAAAAGLSSTISSVTTHAATVKAVLAGFTVVSSITPEQIHQSTLDSLNARLDGIAANTTTLSTAASGLGGYASTILSESTSARGSVAAVGADLSTSGTNLYAADGARAAAQAAATAALAPCLVIEEEVVSAATSSYAGVERACSLILDHVNRILAADCRANLVVVPILSKDSSGFYTAPSVSLAQALQVFLDARKEITQVVSVVSGADYLLRAVVQIRVGVLSGFSQSLVQTAVLAAADGLLRDRKFKVPLYVSDFNPLKALAGVSFVNVTIAGYLSGSSVLTDKLDASGNLIPAASELITKGSVTVSVELATT